MTYLEQIRSLPDEQLALFLYHIMPVDRTTEIDNASRVRYILDVVGEKSDSPCGILFGDNKLLYEELNQEPIGYKYEYIFEYFGEKPYGGWLLKITSEDQLREYFDSRIRPMYAKARQSRETADRDKTHDIYLDVAGLSCMIARQRHGQMSDTVKHTMQVMAIHESIFFDALKENSSIYINRSGAWCMKSKEEKPKLFVRRKSPDFPKYLRDDIRIQQFRQGTHYYAYVGDVQVRDGDILKWNTYDEAYRQACRFTCEKD